MFNKDWNYLNHLCPFSLFFILGFFFFIFKILVEQEDEWGENFGFFELFVGGYEVDTLWFLFLMNY